MTKKYYQLSPEQRYKIAVLVKANYSQTYIANAIGCNKSTISRELKRNVPKRGVGAKIYNADAAQLKTNLRHKEKPKLLFFFN